MLAASLNKTQCGLDQVRDQLRMDVWSNPMVLQLERVCAQALKAEFDN
jgi:hypothetical protein